MKLIKLFLSEVCTRLRLKSVALSLYYYAKLICTFTVKIVEFLRHIIKKEELSEN
jgi:hypothetical protein